jgi:hypothetical protein
VAAGQLGRGEPVDGFGDVVGGDVDGFDDRAAALRGDQRVLCAPYQRNNRRGPGAEPGLCRC